MSKLTDYKELMPFNDNTILVQRDNCMYIKKVVELVDLKIYKKLIGKRNRNVSEIFEIYEYEDRAIVIKEYINGSVLTNIINEYKTFDEKQVKDVISQLCDGLAFLHSLGIVHRDINPNNIIITNDGIVKIIDFDISRFVKRNATADTTILGTVGYAAPEQFGFKQSDKRVDIYAVGVLMNVMLTGEMPNKNIYSGKFGKIIKKAIHMDADVRYKNIKTLKSAITGIVPDDAPLAVKIVRTIPGFRTLTPWKMIIATWIYLAYSPLIFICPYRFAKDFDSTVKTLLAILFTMIIPYILITDLFDVQKRISKKRVLSVIISIIISILVFLLGVFIMPIY